MTQSSGRNGDKRWIKGGTVIVFIFMVREEKGQGTRWPSVTTRRDIKHG